jgi:CcmD family protein
MTVFKRTSLALALSVILAGAAVAGAQPQQPPAPKQEPEQLEEFVPLEDLPPQEQIPAANLLIPAYAVVWIGVLLYVVTVAKRLGTVQKEVERLESDIKAGKRT